MRRARSSASSGDRPRRAGAGREATGARLRVPAMISLFTGMRLGEVMALRWAVSISTAGPFRSAKLWSTPRRTAFGSRRRSQRQAGGISPCPISSLTCFATTGGANWKSE
jgi:hypothetical protein